MRTQLLFAVSIAMALNFSLASADEAEPQSLWKNLKLGGYSSAGVNIHPDGQVEGALNQVSLILSWEDNSRLHFVSELVLERPLRFNENDTVVDKDFYFDLERLYLDYNLSDKLNLRTGRFLNPTGRWNLVHASPLVWTTSRPLATSRLFPESSNGLMLYGAVPLENNAFEYSFFAEVLKESSVNNEEIPFKDTKGAHFTLSGKVNWGLSLLEFREDILGSPRFRLLGLDFLAQHEGWEFSGEAFQRYYSNYSDGGSGGYLQGVAPLGNQWFAVARIENFKRPAEGSSERWLLGTAWRMAPNRVFKIEYVGGDAERSESPKGLLASFSILF